MNMSGSVNLGAIDRHLKKVYDCLNIGSNKKAVQEVDRLPKNLKDLTVFKALKSLALIRMQKTLQAFEILDEINLDDNLDEVTLQTMTSCCKESINVGKIVEMYEAATKRKPNDLDIMSHLFMAYVRVFNFKRQKEVALQMYKNFALKKRLHSFWVIISLVLQSQEPGALETSNSKVCLSLAERMCEKMIDDERIQEEIELYLTILRKQNKHEEEYKFLTGPICSRITDHLSWYKRRQAYLCLDLKMYSRAFKHYFPTLIQEYPDQIEYYQGLFRSAFLLDTEAPSQQQPVALNDQQSQAQSACGTPVKFTSALAECFDIVDKQCQLCLDTQDCSAKDSQQKSARNQSKNLSRTSSLNPSRRGLLRGPFIARAELFNMILSNKDLLPENVYNLCKGHFNKYANFLSLLLEFFQMFSKKVICYYDLDYMLNKFNLRHEDKVELVNNVSEWAQTILKDPTPDLRPNDTLHIQLNKYMLRHSLHNYGPGDSLCDRLKMAKEYIDIYNNQRDLVNPNNGMEFLPIDHYCLLAINCIMTNSITSHMFETAIQQPILTDTVLITIITMTEEACSNSPSNHQIRLVLLKLYSLVGASMHCSTILSSLDIKHFQIDTLGHLLNPVLYDTGNYAFSKESLDTCLGFYAHGIRECLECLTTSYREGRFSKIEEISNVLKKLSGSLNAVQCFLIKGVMDNVTASTVPDLITKSRSFDPFGSLYRVFRDADNADIIKDNRDFKVLKSLHFETDSLVQQRQLETFADEQLWLRLRYYLLRSAIKQLELFSPNKFSGEQKSFDKAEHMHELELGRKEVDELMTKIMDIVKNYNDDRYSYLEPEASPFKRKYIKFESLVNLVKLLVFRTELSELTQEVFNEYSLHLDNIISAVEQQLATVNSLISFKQTLLTLTITVEFISLCVTSLVSLKLETDFLTKTSHYPKPAAAASTSQLQRASNIVSQLICKTMEQLDKLRLSTRAINPKALIIDRITQVDETLLSSPDPERVCVRTKEFTLNCLLGPSHNLSKVKDVILESYSDSLKEIVNACESKARLLRQCV